MKRAKRLKMDRGRCTVCREIVNVVLLAPDLRLAVQHPKAKESNQLGCRGSGAVALDRFAPEGETTTT